jgi:NAD(P)-dependent dehydrogenase (short-subunit alcohol dehydrogenase family)
MSDELRLDGKVALITGAARRVGRAIALELGRAGARIWVHHHTGGAAAAATVAALWEVGVQGTAIAADLRDPLATAALFDRVAAEGGLDVLVNSAAAFERRPFESIDDARLEAMLALNLVAPFRCARLALPLLRARGGVIINVLDVAATQAWPGYAHYCASKAALHMLTRVLAVELAPAVRVCGVSPGTVQPPESYGDADLRRVVEKIPMGRAGSPTDVARAVRFLAAGPEFITGAILAVDGGRGAAGPAVGE